MFTKPELDLLLPLIDAGLKAAGTQVYQVKGNGALMDSILEKLQSNLEKVSPSADGKPTETHGKE